MTSLVDKRSGRELVDAASKYGFGQYLYERFDADDNLAYLNAFCKLQPRPSWASGFGKPNLPPAKEAPHAAASPANFRLSVSRGPMVSTVVMSAKAGEGVQHDTQLMVTLRRGCPFVDVSLLISGKRRNRCPRPVGFASPSRSNSRHSNWDGWVRLSIRLRTFAAAPTTRYFV